MLLYWKPAMEIRGKHLSDTPNWLVCDHCKHDEVLAECEAVAKEGRWGDALVLYRQFVEEIKLHMRMEDEVLYPFYKELDGDPKGEIARLSAEHDYICRLLHDLDSVIKQNNLDHFLTLLESLHEALNQHNDNEEYVFLMMADDSILIHRDKILERLDKIQVQAGKRVWDI